MDNTLILILLSIAIVLLGLAPWVGTNGRLASAAAAILGLLALIGTLVR